MFKKKFKNNIKNKIIRNKYFVKNFKTIIEITINLNDKLYKQIIKQQHSKQRFERKKYQIQLRKR